MGQTASTVSEKVHVVRTPGVCGGKPCIAGTRIRIQDIYVWHELQGQNPEQIIGLFPQLTLADIYAALAYFWDHRAEILEQMRQEEQLAAEANSQIPSKLRGQRGVAPGGGNALPS